MVLKGKYFKLSLWVFHKLSVVQEAGNLKSVWNAYFNERKIDLKGLFISLNLSGSLRCKGRSRLVWLTLLKAVLIGVINRSAGSLIKHFDLREIKRQDSDSEYEFEKNWKVVYDFITEVLKEEPLKVPSLFGGLNVEAFLSRFQDFDTAFVRFKIQRGQNRSD